MELLSSTLITEFHPNWVLHNSGFVPDKVKFHKCLFFNLIFFSFFFQGELIEIDPLKRSYAVSVLEWHPTKLILGVAWKDGSIYIWNLESKEWTQTQSLHKGAITTLQWSSFGTRIASGDEVRNSFTIVFLIKF